MAAKDQGGLSLAAEIPDRDLEEIVAAIKSGAEHPGDALGFGPDALNAMEQMALGFYRAKVYDKAAAIYGFVLQMNSTRATAWRGLGACTQALKRYDLATTCYKKAIATDDLDVPSRVFLGECLCLVGQKPAGLEILEAVIAAGSKDPAYLPYVTRARAVVGAGGGMPSRLQLMQEGRQIALEAEALGAGVEGDTAHLDGTREITWEDMAKSPKLKAAMADLAKAVGEGRLTYAQVGGFSKNELDGAYACACKYADMGQIIQAIQITGYLVFLDPYSAKYYQLIGICLQRMKQYEPAGYYYRMALNLEPSDPMTLVYSGETKIMAGQTDEGLTLVRKGIESAGSKPEFAEIADRGRVLVRQFGA